MRCALLELAAGIFQTTLDTIPAASVPYLAVDAERARAWRTRLQEWPGLQGWTGLRVGITWQGNAGYEFDSQRSIPLAEFAPLADVPGVRLLSLQKYEGLDQLAALRDRFDIVDLGSQLDLDGAFLDTAAVMLNLDLLITSDTAAAHLAGALGVPVWMAVAATCSEWALAVALRDDMPLVPVDASVPATQAWRLARSLRANRG